MAKIYVTVSKDQKTQSGTTIEHVRKVSDKLTLIRAYMPGKRNEDGSYQKSLSTTIKVFTGDNNPTKVECDHKNLAEGTRLIVEVNSLNNNNGFLEIAAASVSIAPARENAGSAPATAAVPADDDEDLPFI